MRNYLKYLLFSWYFRDKTGSWPNAKQKEMFYGVEDTLGKNIFEYSRASGVTTFIVVYAEFLWDMGYSVVCVGERYFKERANDILKNGPHYPIFGTREKITISNQEVLMIDDSNVKPFEGELENLSWLAKKVCLFRTK